MADIATPLSSSNGDNSTVEKAKEQGRQVGSTAKEAGADVLATAKDQSRQVTSQAGRQARDLYGQARTQVRDQAGAQQKRAAEGIRAVGGEIRNMAEQGGQSGPASEIARQASTKIDQVADWLEAREPSAMVNDVKGYARRHPGTFLAGAAILGVLAGRLTRNLTAEAGGSDTASTNATASGADTATTGTLYAGSASGYPDTMTGNPTPRYEPVVDEPVYSPAAADPLDYPATPGSATRLNEGGFRP